MRWMLPVPFASRLGLTVQKGPSTDVVKLEEKKLEIADRQATALARLADFFTGDGLPRVLGAMGQSNAAASLLQGLTTHSGRGGLDARTQVQDAKEICHLVQAVFAEFEEKLSAKARGEVRDPEVKDAEAAFKEWKDGNKTPNV